MSKLVRYYVDGRLFEWVVTVSMLGLALEAFVWPETLQASAFQWVVLVMSNGFAEIFLFSVGWLRIIGLLLNGHQIKGRRVGPLIRSFSAIACAVMWVQFAIALFELSSRQGFPSPGIPFWMMFVVGELYTAYRAVAGDGRTT